MVWNITILPNRPWRIILAMQIPHWTTFLTTSFGSWATNTTGTRRPFFVPYAKNCCKRDQCRPEDKRCTSTVEVKRHRQLRRQNGDQMGNGKYDFRNDQMGNSLLLTVRMSQGSSIAEYNTFPTIRSVPRVWRWLPLGVPWLQRLAVFLKATAHSQTVGTTLCPCGFIIFVQCWSSERRPKGHTYQVRLVLL